MTVVDKIKDEKLQSVNDRAAALSAALTYQHCHLVK